MCLRALPADSVTGKAASYAQYPGYEWVRRDLLFRYGRYVERYADWNVDIVDWAKAAGFPSPLAGRRGNTMAGKPPVPSLTPVERVLEGPRAFWQRVAFRTNLPFPEYLVGLERLRDHSANGHLAFLLGTVFDDGRWYYFPVVLFFKTPLAFLVLAVGGAIGLGREAWRRRRWEWMALAIAPLAMLLPTLATAINIGVRHLLPIYPLLSISGAWMLVRLWQERGRRRLARMSAALLVAWLVTAGATAHPHYLAYFNEAAGRHPERIAVDSNLDWGQDLLFLIKLLEEKKIEEIHLSYWGRARWENLVPQAVKLEPETMVTGWIAISENNLVLGGPDLRGKGFRWLRKHKPVGRAGKSIRLYYVPPVEY